MSCGDVYNTTINVNGNTMFKSRFSPCCCSFSSSMPMSCFGFGFGGMGIGGFGIGGFCPGSFEAGLGMGVGFAAGTALVPAMPKILKGIGKGLSWLGTKVIAPAATFTWNNVLKPIGKAVWTATKAVGKAVWSGIKAIGKGIGSLFHKKNKSAKTKEVKTE